MGSGAVDAASDAQSTFGLTRSNAIEQDRMSRSAAARKARGVKGSIMRPVRKIEAPRYLSAAIGRMKSRVDLERAEAARLERLVLGLQNAMVSAEDRRVLLGEFDRQLTQFERDVNCRFGRLKEARSRMHVLLPARDLFPRVEPSERQKLLDENERLIERALYNEREMVLRKQLLRLYHDHRDVARLRVSLDVLGGGGGDGGEDLGVAEGLRSCIRNLKDQIAKERERIRRLRLPNTHEDDAAVIIQALCRGFLQRKRNGKPLH